jgi:hypothetical protein
MAAARALGFGDTAYKIDQVYIEFENTLPPISAPSFTVFEDRTYYDNLVAPRDYLRVPILGEPVLQIATGYTDYFTDGVDGNQLHFRAQTVGTAGENGVSFSDSVNSTVIGLALVATPSASDKTQDVIVSRAYYGTADQKTKQASGQVGVTWNISFIPTT